MRFGVLGPLTVQADNGAAVTIGSPSQRLVLAMLLAHEGRTVTTDALIDALWCGDPPASANQSLRTYVSRLRQVVGTRLVGHSGSYLLDVSGDELDCSAFERLVDATGSMAPRDAIAALRGALDLWRGRPFGELADVAPLAGVVRRLEEKRVAAWERLAATALEAGDAAAAIAETEQLVAEEPLREGAWSVLVRALVEAHRPGEALRAYQRAVAALADAGLTPSPELRAAEEHALVGGPGSPPPPAPEAGPTQQAVVAGPPARWLTSPALSLIGRDEEIADVCRLLDETHLVTLHGPGGVGKTRLAREVCAQRADRHRLGVRVVELAPVTDPDHVPTAVADALGLAVRRTTVRDALARAHALDALVVFDNCEHVLEPVAHTIDLMRSRAGPLQILTTSRERIGVGGEHSVSIAPLGTTGPDSPARRLFLDRAKIHAPGLVVNAESEAIIDRIVGTLDGLPLAIEMAAARLVGLGLRDLDTLLVDRLDVLQSSDRLGDARHRTLDAVIEWSEQLLADHERRTLRQLAVFAGNVRADDIGSVLGDPGAMVTVGDLVARSLVVAHHRPGRTTYGLLGMVRRRGRDQLAAAREADALERRHAEHFTEVARDADGQLRSEDEATASGVFELLSDELRAAHGWARDHDPGLARALSGALHLHAVSRQREEPLRWAEDMVSLLDRSADSAMVLSSIAYRANNLGRFDDAESAAELALEIAGPDPVSRFAWDAYVDAALYRGRLDAARERGVHLHDTAVAADDSYMRALGIAALALSQAYAGHTDAALEAIGLAEGVVFGPSGRGWVSYAEGEVLLVADPSAAGASLVTAIDAADAVDNRFLAGVARVSLASLLGRTGETREALAAFAEIVAHWRHRGDRTHQLTTLRNLAELFNRVEAHRAAAELLGAVRAADDTSFGEEAARLDAVTADVRVVLGETVFARFMGAGARRDVPTAADRALEAIEELLD